MHMQKQLQLSNSSVKNKKETEKENRAICGNTLTVRRVFVRLSLQLSYRFEIFQNKTGGGKTRDYRYKLYLREHIVDERRCCIEECVLIGDNEKNTL